MKNHMKHVETRNSEVRRWVATRCGRTMPAIRATTLPCPRRPIGRRQNVNPEVEFYWTQLWFADLRCNWKKLTDGTFTRIMKRGYQWIWGNWMILNSGDHHFAFAVVHMSSFRCLGMERWTTAWGLGRWAEKAGVSGGKPVSWNLWVPINLKKNSDLVGGGAHFFSDFLLMLIFWNRFFLQFSNGTRNISEHLGADLCLLTCQKVVEPLTIFNVRPCQTHKKWKKLQLSKAEMSKMDSLWEMTDMNRSY